MPTVDDQVLNRSGRRLDGAFDQRRARSSSPVKKRSLMYADLPPIPIAAEEDIKSVSSGGSRISEELKQLSKSPVSKRLHINTTGSRYVIPIPFTLQLPPKLSPSNRSPVASRSPSPERLKSPSRLMYTGNGYEMFESDEDTGFLEAQLNKAIAISPRTPTKPPTGAKGIYTKPKKQLDEMSVIDEVPSGANSRASSVYSKHGKKVAEQPPPVPEKSTARLPTSKSGPINRTPYPMDVNNEMIQQKRSVTDLRRRPPPPMKSFGQLQKTTTLADISQHRDSEKSPYRDSTLDYRVFSNESGVSSSRSFSSVEDAIRERLVSDFTRGFGNYKYSREDNDQESSSDSSSISDSESGSDASSVTASSASWDSIQNSVDITINDGKSVIEEASASDVDRSWTYSDSSMEAATQNKNTVVNNLYLANNQSSPMVANKQTDMESETSQSEEDASNVSNGSQVENEGLGKSFSFPNNLTNITNSPSMKSRADPYESQTKRSDYSTPNGQIEIPNIDNYDDVYGWKSEDVNENEDSEVSEESENEEPASMATAQIEDVHAEAQLTDTAPPLEPIGFPSAAAKKVVKLQFLDMYDGSDSETDSDIGSITYSAYSTTPKSVSTPCLSSGTQKSLPPLPDYNAKVPATTSLQSSASIKPTHSRPGHARSKSVDLDSLFSMNMRDSVNSTQHQKTTDATDTDAQNIVVSEPPQKVLYEVDFNEVEKGNDEMQTPHGLDRTFTEHLRNTLGKMQKLDLNAQKGRSFTVPPRLPEKMVPSFERQMFRLPPKQTIDDNSSTSATSYQSSRTAISNDSTAASDTESVVIDLTGDGVDICTVKRNNSTASYISITEKTKDGNAVEVVLVDDDEPGDELASLYSKYRNDNWVFRTNSTTSSSASFSSAASYDSIARSETNLRLKPKTLAVPTAEVKGYRASPRVMGNAAAGSLKASLQHPSRRPSRLQNGGLQSARNLPVMQERYH